MDAWPGGQTSRQHTYRQADRQADRQAERQTDTETDRRSDFLGQNSGIREKGMEEEREARR